MPKRKSTLNKGKAREQKMQQITDAKKEEINKKRRAKRAKK